MDISPMMETFMTLFFVPQFLRSWWNQRYCQNMTNPSTKKPLPPGAMGWPIIGETIQFLIQGTDFYTKRLKKYGQIFKTHILGFPTIRVAGDEHISELISREPEQLSMNWPTAVRVLMGEKSLPVVTGPEHPQLKKDLQTAFTPKRLADYLPNIQQHIQAHFQLWTNESEKNQKIFSFPACESLVADIMLELVLGCHKEDDKDGSVRRAFRDINHNIFSVPIKFPGGGFSRGVQAREIILDFIKMKMSGNGRGRDHVSFMDILLSHYGQGDGFNDEKKIEDNLLGTMIAGAASLAGALTGLLLLLGTNGDVLEKVKDEIRDAGLFAKDAEADLNYDLLQKLEYVHCVEKEALRYLPPVGGCFRKAENTMELDNYQFPKDWKIIYSIRDTHILAAQKQLDGNVFRPSRWQESEENGSSPPLKIKDEMSSCRYIPFGFGHRMCLGRQLARMILHLFIIELARSAKWEILNPNCPLVHLPVTKPSDDMPMMFHMTQLKEGKKF